MKDKRSINIPTVTRFVREVLGCNCPDEVFREVEIQRGSPAVKSLAADYEIRIGGRLLVVLTSEPAERLVGPRLEQAFEEGKRARDGSGFNRFRLVVAVRDAAQEKEKLLRAFQDIPSRDEKTHLHVVDKQTVPDFFLKAPPPSS